MNGLGERAGNAALEEFAMAMKYVGGFDLHLHTDRFRELSEYVAHASNRPIPTWKPIVGANLFVYESENRASAALKDSLTYEVFPPEEVGLQRAFMLGKYSGVETLKVKLAEYKLKATDAEAAVLTMRIRSRSIALKRALFDEELLDIYRSEIENVREEVRDSGRDGRDMVAVAAADAAASLAEVVDDQS